MRGNDAVWAGLRKLMTARGSFVGRILESDSRWHAWGSFAEKRRIQVSDLRIKRPSESSRSGIDARQIPFAISGIVGHECPTYAYPQYGGGHKKAACVAKRSCEAKTLHTGFSFATPLRYAGCLWLDAYLMFSGMRYRRVASVSPLGRRLGTMVWLSVESMPKSSSLIIHSVLPPSATHIPSNLDD